MIPRHRIFSNAPGRQENLLAEAKHMIAMQQGHISELQEQIDAYKRSGTEMTLLPDAPENDDGGGDGPAVGAAAPLSLDGGDDELEPLRKEREAPDHAADVGGAAARDVGGEGAPPVTPPQARLSPRAANPSPRSAGPRSPSKAAYADVAALRLDNDRLAAKAGLLTGGVPISKWRALSPDICR